VARSAALIAVLATMGPWYAARAQGVAAASNRLLPYAESRADVIIGNGTAGEVGAGVQLPVGYYVRVGLTGAVGATQRDGDALTSVRGDIIARYLLDPFRETRWAVSLGGGVSLPYMDGDTHTQPFMTLVLDVEGPRTNGVSPAIQLGLGGGTRIGIVLRTSKGPWR
jgi:hypothetical protein